MRPKSRSIFKAAIFLALVMALTLAQAAGAGKVHFNSIIFQLGSLVASGDMAGLGNDTFYVTLVADGTVKAMCQNKGGNLAPGRNPIRATIRQTDQYVTDRNGHVQVRVTAQDPTLAYFQPSPTPKQAGCPNGKWTVVGIQEGTTNWTGARILVKDINGVSQFDQSYTCKTYFDQNGISYDVDCWEN
jgi:hypothetical protein